jgi:hypothetical protein
VPLTPEKLRELSSLNLSDEQAEETIRLLEQIARILYGAISRKEQAGQNENKNKAKS